MSNYSAIHRYDQIINNVRSGVRELPTEHRAMIDAQNCCRYCGKKFNQQGLSTHEKYCGK